MSPVLYPAYEDEDLSFLNKPQVREADATTSFGGYFYVAGIAIASGRDDPNTFYLHADGKWRKSTFDGEKMSAYFETRRVAKEILDRANIRRHLMFRANLTADEAVHNYEAGLYRR